VWPEAPNAKINDQSTNFHKKKVLKRLSRKRRSLMRMIGQRKSRIVKRSILMEDNASNLGDSSDSEF
jgi:hypothetical protein